MEERIVLLAGGLAYVELEAPFWTCLSEMANEKQISVQELIQILIDQDTDNLSSALRVHVLAHVCQRAGSLFISQADAGVHESLPSYH